MEQYRVPNKLPSEEINILAQRKGRLKQAAQRTAPAPRKKNNRYSFKKIEKIVAASRIAERDTKRILRNFLQTGFRLKNPEIEEGRLILIYRHRAKRVENKPVLRYLNDLNLPFMKCAAFHRLTPEVHAMLKIVEPYVIWGYPQMTVIHDLIFKYGALRNTDTNLRAKSVPLSSNKLVEDIFGTYGIICVDDLVHEIMTLGPNFDKVQQHFRSFVLRNPLGGWKGARKGKLRSIGGEAGFRGDAINELFQKLL
uniref:Uncharacterized protein n=1 Tax=Anopheles atroparvus TaxID=41427 RepID=A0A182J211_ANOAO